VKIIRKIRDAWNTQRRMRVIADWRCRCGLRVLDDGGGCVWHESVRRQCLDGTIKTAEEAR
jgi:hypothetical protein